MKGVSRLSAADIANGLINTVQAARMRRTRLFFDNRQEFMRLLVADVAKAVRKCDKEGTTCVIRLNGTSDIRFEIVPTDTHASIMEQFAGIQFYDYTKIANRRNKHSNYHLTFSLADGNDAQALHAIKHGMTVAAVFRDKDTVARYMADGFAFMGDDKKYSVINGDVSDMRYKDAAGVVVALYAKGNGAKDTSGFVRD